MQITETMVRNALAKNYKVVYRVTPIYKGNDLMDKGILVQAKSTNGKLNLNRYLYNVQPGLRFNYATRRSTIDHSMKVPYPPMSYSYKYSSPPKMELQIK